MFLIHKIAGFQTRQEILLVRVIQSHLIFKFYLQETQLSLIFNFFGASCRCYTSAVPKVPCPRFLDLNGPLQIGGLPNLQSQFQIQNRHYRGCIRDFYIDNQLLDLNKFVFNQGTVAGCAEKTNQCISAPCKHGGETSSKSKLL